MPSRHRSYSLSQIKPTGKCLVCEGTLPKRARKYCSPEHAREMLARYDYQAMVADVLRRDKTCVLCGSAGGGKVLEVDHIVPVSDGGEIFDRSNCRALCHGCHVNVTGEWRRKKALAHRETKETHRLAKYVQPWPLLETGGYEEE